MDIKDHILAELKQIEQKEQVKVLYAIESGSRSWGFASKDSDYDVRFIYVHPLDWYLSVEDRRDVIEYPVFDQLDISGWDIKKTLQLFNKSNSPLGEWLASPIVYIEASNFAQQLRDLMPTFYSPLACLRHYLSMAKGNYRSNLTQQQVWVKKYFYVLRPILACMWIEKHHTMPPMEFAKLLHAQTLDISLLQEITKLLEKKRAGKELDSGERIEIINNFLEKQISHFEDYTKTHTFERPRKDGVLESILQSTILQYDDSRNSSFRG